MNLPCRVFYVLAISSIAATPCLALPRRQSKTVLVSAAASLTDAMNELGMAFTKKHPEIKIQFNFGASGTLEQQIEQGAPVDVFASAGEKEMNDLEHAGEIAKRSRIDFASNRLALIAPISSRLKDWSGLAGQSVARVALPKPEFVPSGRYGKETLIHRQLWSGLSSKIVYANNVRQALAYVADGDVDAGIVFVTDAKVDSTKVRIVALDHPRGDHSPIHYPAAAIGRSHDPRDANLFLKFLVSPPGQTILARWGFAPPR